jgi:hypothetical protein
VVLPHSTQVSRQLVILRGPLLRASMPVNVKNQTGDYVQTLIATPVIRLKLTPAAPPAVSIRSGPAGPQAVIHWGTPYAHRKMYIAQWVRCTHELGGVIIGYASWQPVAAGDTLTAQCSDALDWDAVVGRLGQRVARIRYRSVHTALREAVHRTLPDRQRYMAIDHGVDGM